jgi:hypothetical protein
MRAVAVAAAVSVLLAVAPAAAPTSSSADPAGPARARYHVVARTTSTSVEAGADVVRVVGRVKPWAAGEKVHLLQRLSGSRRWTRTDSARLTRTSRFVLRDRPSRPGVRYYRVLKPASDGLGADRSALMRVDVMAWERLADRQPWAGCGLQPGSTVRIGGLDYPGSLQFTGYIGSCMPYIVYDLGGRCRTLRATYGFVDGLWHAGAVGTATVSDDTGLRELYRVDDGRRTFVDQELDITGIQRLHLGLGSANADPAAPVSPMAAGTPEVLCMP